VTAAAKVPAPDAAAVLAHLQPARMTSPQEVQVLELVTQMATIVRDQRNEIGQLRSDVARVDAATTARLGDFERRIALAEARNAVGEATDAGVSDPAPASIQAMAKSPPAPPTTVVTRADAVLTTARDGGSKRYRVQAASPGLAMLAEIDRGGGDGAQLQVQVGDSIPGYGKVKSVSQRGTAWVVSTDSGNIQ
jgi:hypothetical protein